MNKRRLLKLADLLEADAKNKSGVKFDLSIVGESTEYGTEYEPALDCGTTACAMGLAALSGAFKSSAGLSYKIDGRFIDTTVNGRRVRYDRAAMRLFDISMKQADFLFTPGESYAWVTPREAEGELLVAQRIRDFVAGKVHPSA